MSTHEIDKHSRLSGDMIFFSNAFRSRCIVRGCGTLNVGGPVPGHFKIVGLNTQVDTNVSMLLWNDFVMGVALRMVVALSTPPTWIRLLLARVRAARVWTVSLERCWSRCFWIDFCRGPYNNKVATFPHHGQLRMRVLLAFGWPLLAHGWRICSRRVGIHMVGNLAYLTHAAHWKL